MLDFLSIRGTVVENYPLTFRRARLLLTSCQFSRSYGYAIHTECWLWICLPGLIIFRGSQHIPDTRTAQDDLRVGWISFDLLP